MSYHPGANLAGEDGYGVRGMNPETTSTDHSTSTLHSLSMTRTSKSDPFTTFPEDDSETGTSLYNISNFFGFFLNSCSAELWAVRVKIITEHWAVIVHGTSVVLLRSDCCKVEWLLIYEFLARDVMVAMWEEIKQKVLIACHCIWHQHCGHILIFRISRYWLQTVNCFHFYNGVRVRLKNY